MVHTRKNARITITYLDIYPQYPEVLENEQNAFLHIRVQNIRVYFCVFPYVPCYYCEYPKFQLPNCCLMALITFLDCGEKAEGMEHES